MELGRFHSCAAAVTLAALTLSGCKATPFVAVPGAPSNASSMRDANPKKLLYIMDQDAGVVRVFDLETGAKEGELRNFSYPKGACVDAAGDIYIANWGFTTVNEYRHGEIRPLRTIQTDGSPVGCSISPNGDLAIANEHTETGGGDVLVFKQAKGKPVTYSNGKCDRIGAAGYDGAGNLYIETENYQSSTICELPAGGTSLKSVGSNVRLNQPGGVMWDGQHITLTDTGYASYSGTAIYQMKEAASGKLLKIGRTVLTTGGCGQAARVDRPFILGAVNTPKNQQLADEVVGGSYSYGCTKFSIWKYPDGGAPMRTIKVPPVAFASQAVGIGK